MGEKIPGPAAIPFLGNALLVLTKKPFGMCLTFPTNFINVKDCNETWCV